MSAEEHEGRAADGPPSLQPSRPDGEATRYGSDPPADADATRYRAAAAPADPDPTRYGEPPAGPDGREGTHYSTPTADPENTGYTPTFAREGGRTDGPLPCRFGNYVLLERLAEGGMGVVYKARQVSLNRLVALKIVLAGRDADAEERERFRAEAGSVARLSHPNVVQVYEVGEHDGVPFLALEFCAQGSLDRRLGRTPLPAREAARLVEVLARAVQSAHQAGVVHRDLKPANMLLAEDGTPKVTDFGLAKVLGEEGRTLSGATLGTPSYMAPEQAAGNTRGVCPAADVSALGAILYEVLTGRPPFRGATLLDTLEQVRSQDPVPPGRLLPKTPRTWRLSA